MSRTYNKTIGYSDSNPYMKKLSNKIFRRKSKASLSEDPEESLYPVKKYEGVNPYDICDWSMLYFTDVEKYKKEYLEYDPEYKWYRFVFK